MESRLDPRPLKSRSRRLQLAPKGPVLHPLATSALPGPRPVPAVMNWLTGGKRRINKARRKHAGSASGSMAAGSGSKSLVASHAVFRKPRGGGGLSRDIQTLRRHASRSAVVPKRLEEVASRTPTRSGASLSPVDLGDAFVFASTSSSSSSADLVGESARGRSARWLIFCLFVVYSRRAITILARCCPPDAAFYFGVGGLNLDQLFAARICIHQPNDASHTFAFAPHSPSAPL